MTAGCPQYRVFTKRRGHETVKLESGNGPFDFRFSALTERDRLFKSSQDILACWIEKEGVPTGRTLVRS